MKKRPDDRVMDLLRSGEGIISVDEIEDVIRNGVCTHGWPQIDLCRACFTRELTRRSLTYLAIKLGCSPDDARAVGDKLMAAAQPAEGSQP